ncbi:hypothetical protein HQQ81_05455 [Microbacteriaceae bacterium VKM Ac-2854]|nr:hypothetical protein [Microbacteriaceae bacterium VKM Ac-2854]
MAIHSRIALAALGTVAVGVLVGCTPAAQDAAEMSATPTSASCALAEATVVPSEYIGTTSNYILTRVDRITDGAPDRAEQIPLQNDATWIGDVVGGLATDEETWAAGILDALVRDRYLPDGAGAALRSTSSPDAPAGSLIGSAGREIRTDVTVSCDGEEYFTTEFRSFLPNNYGIVIGCPDTGPVVADTRDTPGGEQVRQELATYCEASSE